MALLGAEYMSNNNHIFIAHLGKKISRIRKLRGYNQFEFADKCGKMVNTISKIERGIGNPRITTLLDISNALDITLQELLNINTEEEFVSKQNNKKIALDFINNLSKIDDKTLKVLNDITSIL